MPRRSRKYEIGLAERLRDRRHAVNYLNAAAEDSDEAFLLALRDVAEAQKGMTRVSTDAHVNRENLYRMLSKVGNPRYLNFRSILRALRLKFHVEDDSGSSNLSRSPSTTTQTKIERTRSTRGSPKIDQMVLPFIPASYPHNQPSAAGTISLTVKAGLFTANAAPIVVGFGSGRSSMQSKAGSMFPLNSGQAYFQGIVGNILSVADKTQREEAELVIPKYGFQSAAPRDPVRELTGQNIGEVQ